MWERLSIDELCRNTSKIFFVDITVTIIFVKLTGLPQIQFNKMHLIFTALWASCCNTQQYNTARPYDLTYLINWSIMSNA